MKWRDQTGNEKLKLFKQIQIPAVFPHFPNGDTVQNIWKDFLEIYDLLRSKACMNIEEIRIFQLKNK